MSAHKSGFVGLVGRPNVGKSTILNWYVGEKVSIVSPSPQTTRQRVLGVVTRDDAQALFLDTPGLHKPQHTLGRAMVGIAKTVLADADVLVVVIDGRAGITEEDERVWSSVRAVKRPRLLAINKVDVTRKPRLLPLLDAAAKTRLFAECIPVSALTGEQMPVLLDRIIALLPEGPRWYEPGQRTDQPSEQVMSELIREQVLLATRQEVPQSIAVLIDSIEERPNRLLAIQATILVERPGQKAILIGHAGSMLKRIGQAARQELERFAGRKVYLGLWVKLAEGWRHDERVLRQLGLLDSAKRS